MENKGGTVEWNAAAQINMTLAELNNQACAAFISKQYRKAMDARISQKTCAIFSFSPEERKAFAKIEADFNKALPYLGLRGSWNSKESKIGSDAEILARRLYDRYSEILADTLDKHGWFGSRKQDSSKMRIRNKPEENE